MTLISSDNLKEKLQEISVSKLKKIGLLMPGNPFCENYYSLFKYICCKLNISIKVSSTIFG